MGMEAGWMGLIATVRDFSRIGLMLANNGLWNGQQLVSESWLRESTTADSSVVELLPGQTIMGYGYQWWIPQGEGDFLSVGNAGQFIYVNPKNNVVIVQTSAHPSWSKLSKEEAVIVFRSIANR
jgi:CubicO group peptidase (beta-lactamase class C family)